MTVTASRPTGHPGYSETLARKPESVATARRLVRTALAAWGLEELADDGTLVASELVTNAIQYARSDAIRIVVTRPDSASVHIGVVDKSKAFPVLRSADAGDEQGRGLALVEELTHQWGTDRLPWGKRVWGELRADGR